MRGNCNSLRMQDSNLNFSSRGIGNVSKISRYRNLWLQLSKLTQNLGNCAGLSYGGQILCLFAISILLIYGFMIELTERFNYIFFTSALLFQVIIFSLCNFAYNVSNEVGIKFSERLHDVLNTLSAANTEEIHEMRYFLAVIGRNPPIISFSGFVYVNRKLITSLISAMVTYLIVLMQFQQSETPSQSESASV